MKLTGYTDPMSARPGDTVRFMVSSELPKYKAEIVRLIHGDPNPKGPGTKYERIKTTVSKEYPGRVQKIPVGSYIEVPDSPLLRLEPGFTVQAWIRPTTPGKGAQSIVSHGGWRLGLDAAGHVEFRVGDKGGAGVRAGMPTRQHEWYFVAASWDAKSGAARVYQYPQRWMEPHSGVWTEEKLSVKPAFGGGPLLIAAAKSGREVSQHYNGKIENPRIFNRALTETEVLSLKAGAPANTFATSLVAAWDFAAGSSTQQATDASPNRLHGRVVNMPLRAAIGHNWDGTEYNFAHAPEQYGAIHFHDDDIDDAGWDTDFEWVVPKGTKSGFYAALITSGKEHDFIPFFVRPHVGAAGAPIAYLAPTNTYIAYGNEHIPGLTTEWLPNAKLHLHQAEREYVIKAGLNSMYDHHRDGSGVAYGSRKVPIPNIRPDYVNPPRGSPHALAADLYLIDWMEAKGFKYDVFTDEDLHLDGPALLSPYKVLVTGSHPEYWSGPMLDAVETYLANGGRLMYLGGNGFYWVTSLDPDRPHVIEIRRWGGTESWKAEPGEYYHSTTGELGGLWRKRGRTPQRLTGVGFTAQGFDQNQPYKRKPDSLDKRAAFIFEGVGKDEVIGDFDSLLLNWGAAGDEIDRYDLALGTPPHTLLLATSFGHSDAYLLVIEEAGITTPDLGGTRHPLVHSDVAYMETPNGGGVFSVGSISWMGSLSYNNYDNNVSRITENVMRRFVSDEPLPPIPAT
ncbi:MAG: LamG domain-containing protein [SAR202 cluster bacterium]|nr:LamG domain-containing protein [SAR202 cluster bacterium]